MENLIVLLIVLFIVWRLYKKITTPRRIKPQPIEHETVQGLRKQQRRNRINNDLEMVLAGKRDPGGRFAINYQIIPDDIAKRGNRDEIMTEYNRLIDEENKNHKAFLENTDSYFQD